MKKAVESIVSVAESFIEAIRSREFWLYMDEKLKYVLPGCLCLAIFLIDLYILIRTV